VLDTVHQVETPEGVDLDLRVAGPPVRFVAWLLDWLVRLVAAFVIAIPLFMFGGFGLGAFLLVMFVLEELYPILFEVLSNGSTPGKKALGLHVVHADGTPVGWVSSVLRNLLRTADLLPTVYAFGLISMLFTKSFQRLGDLAAGTLVVYRDEARSKEVVANAEPRPAPVGLRLAEQRAVIAFGQRGPQLSPARTRELAELAAPLLDAEPTQISEPIAYLYGIAAWLIGRRGKAL